MYQLVLNICVAENVRDKQRTDNDYKVKTLITYLYFF